MPAPGSTSPDITAARLHALATADVVVAGRMPWSSNATFLCELWPCGSRPDGGLNSARTEDEDADGGDGDGDGPRRTVDEVGGPLGRAIYKPHRGERPLWDFPDGLYLREAAAYTLAGALGWDLVPPTIVRDGPLGPGSLQWFIDADYDEHHFTLVEEESYHPQLRRMCAFDIVANSTDRKGGHVLVDEHRHLWGIDNGLCLHAEFKLRTVIWEFATEFIPDELADDLAAFVERPLPAELCEVLDPFERDAVHQRARALLSAGRFPIDETGRRYPWPLV
ncbi:MAG: SCO1664 family protein [Acidimicrobiales bacterium]